MSRRRLPLALALALLLLTATVACSGNDDDEGQREPSVTRTAFQTEKQMLSWAGFHELSDVQLINVQEDTGIDAAVSFVLRGMPTDIDDVLISAGVEAQFEAGVPAALDAPADFDVESLSNVRSASDTTTADDGEVVHRRMTRGSVDDEDLLHVLAFTT